ncbi:p19 [Tobacco virus 1]|uniref:p19 n=1 Tax=Tobacco virus 1 TaxID=1692045 RepID=A0A0K1HRM1_9CLOS|nr:p19 [Tobacco virus 1]AKT94764.1 p19 [Tobacco virus 1]
MLSDYEVGSNNSSHYLAIAVVCSENSDELLMFESEDSNENAIFFEDSCVISKSPSGGALNCAENYYLTSNAGLLDFLKSTNFKSPKPLPVANRCSNGPNHVDFHMRPLHLGLIFRVNLSLKSLDDLDTFQDSLVKIKGFWNNGAQHQSMFHYLSNFINYEKYSIVSFEYFKL